MTLKYIILILITFFGSVVMVHGQEAVSSDEEKRLKEIQEQLEENEKSAQVLRDAAEQRAQELISIRETVLETADSLKEAEQNATRIESRLAVLTKDVAEAQTNLAAQQLALSETLAALQAVEMSRPPALAISPDDAAQAARAAMAFSTVAPELETRAESLRREIDRLARLRSEMSEQKFALRQEEVDLKARREVLQDLHSRKEKAVLRNNERADQLESENVALAEEATSIREVLDKLAAAPTQEDPNINLPPAPEPIIGSLASAPSPRLKPKNGAIAKRPGVEIYKTLPALFSKAKGKLPFPATGRLIAKFGSKTADNNKLDGLQIETRSLAVVTAPFRGKVAFAGNLGRLGNVLMLDVGDGYHLIFVGLGKFNAAAGQSIKAGDVVGFMPLTPNNAGRARQNLYFEIRRNRDPVDPSHWLMRAEG